VAAEGARAGGIIKKTCRLQWRRKEEVPMSTVREEAHRLVDELPEEASWDDLMYQIYVRQKVEAGRRAIAEGRLNTQEEVEARMARWLDGR
jgi:predicted transcriptional regulator